VTSIKSQVNKQMRFIHVIVLSVLVSGCALINPEEDKDIPLPAPPPKPIEKSQFDELLDFAANFAGMPATPRTETCRALLKNQKEHPGPQIQLRLLVGRLYSDNCGEISKILEGVAALPAETVAEDRLQKLVTTYKEALKRMMTSAKKINVLERKQKAVETESALEPKPVAKEPKNGESSLLRDKLEAIRSMEKQLDEKKDGN